MAISTSPATGARGAVHVGSETTYGTAVSPTHVIDFTSESLAASENVIESEAIRASRGRHKLIRGNLDIQGDISFEQSASGYGLLLRHALGDYVKIEKADGGVHGRMNVDAVVELPAASGSTLNDGRAITLADDHSSGFDSTGAKFCIVHRDADDDLQLDDNAGSGYSYDSYGPKSETYVTSFTASDSDGNSGSAPSIEVKHVFDADGNEVQPEYSENGGVLKIGPNRNEYRYYHVDVGNGTTDEVKLFLVDADVTTHGDPSANEAVEGVASLTVDSTSFAGGPDIAKGNWVYEFDDANYTGVFTHHIERGRFLPTGLTVEIDRDAAIFLYAGCKVNTLTLNFETNSIVTGTIALVGRNEFAMAELNEDVVPGATTIDIKNAEAFPSAGTISIGERTDITYTSKTDQGDDVWQLGGIPATGDNAIDRFHAKETNVDSKTSTAIASPIEGNDDPLTSFETVVYVDGYFEEALSGSLTLNNNLNTDKFGLGSRSRLQLVEQQAVVEASLNLEFDDGKMYKRFTEADYFSLEFKCISEADGSEIGNTDVLSQAYYFMPKCKFNGNTPQIQGTEYITHEMPVTCIYDDDLDTTDLVIILVNSSTEDAVKA